MATDAMDWLPTVPPSYHNPYPFTQSMPGGWPESLPPTTYTTSVFTRKRKSVSIWSAAKRVCFGLWSLARHATTTATKPAYIIIREFRARSREASRRPHRRSPADRRRLTEFPRREPANIYQNLVAQRIEEQQQAAQSQVATPPSTPPRVARTYIPGYGLGTDARTSDFTDTRSSPTNTETLFSGQITNTKFTSVSPLSDTDTSDYTPAASSSTNTETPLCDGYYVPKSHVVTSPSIAAARAGIKRRRSQELDPEDIFVALQNQVESDQFWMNRPHRKNMKGFNPFEGAQQRPSTPKPPPAAIGVPITSPQNGKTFMNPWSLAKPINVSPPPSPSMQLQDELQSHVSEYGEDYYEQLAEKPTKPDLSSHLESHDDRWFSVPVMDLFSRESRYANDSAVSANSEAETQPNSAMSGILSQMSKLFYTSDARHTPPPVRSRTMVSAQVPPPIFKNESPPGQVPENTEHVTLESPIPPVAASASKEPAPKKEEDNILRKLKIPTWTQKEVDEMCGRKTSEPTTPSKKATETLSEQPDETPATKDIHATFETPSERLSKLNLDAVDTDTPKAGYHSDFKTARKTRYREAYEKLQKAKLEEYELVPITDAWDKKVRSAVRTGIPEYLGPHDLARVVPQYAGRGQDNWLNDETINKYLEIVAAHGRKSDRPDQTRTHHAFNNFFYNNLRDKGPESVMRWSKRAKIGGKALAQVEKVFVPINSGAHWTLAVVEPKDKRITHYNSMRGTATGVKACQDLKKWVAAELKGDFNEDEWTVTSVGESPQQTNSDDCGVFTITSARQIMLGYTPMSYGSSQIPVQRVRIVAELINRGLLRSSEQ